MPPKRALQQRNRASVPDSGGKKQKQAKESVRPTGISGITVNTRAVLASRQEKSKSSNINDDTFLHVGTAEDHVAVDVEVPLEAGRENTVTGNFAQLDSSIIIRTTNENVMGVDAITARMPPNEMNGADDMDDNRRAAVEEANRCWRMRQETEDVRATTDAAVLVEGSVTENAGPVKKGKAGYKKIGDFLLTTKQKAKVKHVIDQNLFGMMKFAIDTDLSEISTRIAKNVLKLDDEKTRQKTIHSIEKEIKEKIRMRRISVLRSCRTKWTSK